MIFSGTVRHNLDPVGRATSDADLWAAVRSAGLYDALHSLQACASPASMQVPNSTLRQCIMVILSMAVLGAATSADQSNEDCEPMMLIQSA